MEIRIGLSLLLLLTYSISALSKNIRDGPNLRSRQAKRDTPSEFLRPPAPGGNILNRSPSTNLAPPPFLPPPPGSFRNGKFISASRTPGTEDSRGYFSRLMSWLNPWSNNGVAPSSQNLQKPPLYQTEDQRSVTRNGPFNPERSCNPCNDVPWTPIRNIANEPSNNYQQNLNYNIGYHVPSPSHEIREPDFNYSPLKNVHPPPTFANHPIPNPHIYPGAMPPLYKATQFSSTGNIHFQGNYNYPGPNFQQRNESPTLGSSHEPEAQASGTREIGTQSHGSIQGQESLDQKIRTEDHKQLDKIVEGQKTREQGIQGQPSQLQGQESLSKGTHDLKGQVHGVFGQKIQGQVVNIQKNRNQGFEISTDDNQEQGTKTVQVSQGNQGQRENSHFEVIPSIGGQISSEQIYYEKSPIIDLSVSSVSSTPLTLTETYSSDDLEESQETSTRSSSLIDYLVAGYDDRIPIAQSSGVIKSAGSSLSPRPIDSRVPVDTQNPIDSTELSEIDYYNSGRSQEDLSYNEKQPFLEALMESYNNFKKEEKSSFRDSKTSATNFENSSDDNLPFSIPLTRTAKKNKQVQIIIPYTSQFTPSPFHTPIVDNRNGEIEMQLPRRVPSDIHYDPFDDGVLAQESNTVSVTSLPDTPSTSSAPLDGKNNSIDVQRLQKNIDNWTIQEYSKGMIASTIIVPNATHPYLSPSKKIPKEYFTTKQPNNTSDEIYDEDAKRVSSSEFDFEDYKQMTTFEISRVTQEPKTVTRTSSIISQESDGNRLNQIETKENEILPSRNEDESSNNKKELLKVHPVFANTSMYKNSEKVYVVTPLPVGEKELKKAFEVELKKKPKKKEIEKIVKIERAYQVLPQAVNNLAVASTGPESVPLWGIMEHEEFASSNSDTNSQLPILYAGHSKVSHARR